MTLTPQTFLARGFLLMVILTAGLIGGCASQPSQAPKKTYSFWPAAPDDPHVQFLTAFNSSSAIQKQRSKMDEMLYGPAEILPIGKPYGVAMWQGKVYVCDVRSHGVTVMDIKNRQTRIVGLSKGQEIRKAVDIAIAPDGFKYVVDGSGKTIVVLDPEDKTDAVFTYKGDKKPDPKNPQQTSEGFSPVSVAVYGNELFVVDFTGHCVKVMDRNTGKYLRNIGGIGSADGQFEWPLVVRVNPQGFVYVVDVLRCRIQKFTREGKFVEAFCQPGNRPGDLARPKHFSFDKNGFLYIADTRFNNVQVFDELGKIVDYFGSAGGHPGSMDLPTGVFVDETTEDLELFRGYIHPAFEAERLIVVTNQFGLQRVAFYAVGHLKPGKTLADLAPSRHKVSTGTNATTQPSTQPAFGPQIPTPGMITTQPAPK